jgi:metallo-beta-lactamase family protein
MFQGAKFTEEKNHQPFPFNPSELDAVLVTHAHLDHTGRLPKLIHDGYGGLITSTAPTHALTSLVLEDALHVMTENTKYTDEEPLYTEADIKRVSESSQGVGYHEQVTVAPGITAVFHDAGHVLGSAYISIEAEGRRIVFSGDIGNDSVPILAETEPISEAEIVICESTYGHRLHESAGERIDILKTYLEQTIRNSGSLIIPAFSIERTQELLYELNNLLLKKLKTKMPIFLDSPMAIRATELYRRFKTYLQFDAPIFSDPDGDFFSFPNLRETLTTEDSKAINDIPAPKVIIAGSGMMTGGRILHHLIRSLPDKNSMVLIIGYQASGSLGRRLYEGADKVKIMRQEVKVEATVKALGSFSAHGDQNKLTRWLKPEKGKIKRVFVNHGDEEAAMVFATHLRHVYRNEVEVPKEGEGFEV